MIVKKRFRDLKPGELFCLREGDAAGENVFLAVDFDIFHLDRVIRAKDEMGGGRAVVIGGEHAGQHDGCFEADTPVALVRATFDVCQERAE